MKGPSLWVNIEAVPSLIARPDWAVAGRAELADLGVRRACSRVPRLPMVPGRTTPLTGRPVFVFGLEIK